MQRPLKITSRDFALSEAVETEIREKASALENYYERLSGCEVTVHAPAIKHHRKGGPFLVGIRLTVPGKELAVDRQAEEELSQAIREAFDAARRQLEDYVRELRGAVKTHEPGASAASPASNPNSTMALSKRPTIAKYIFIAIACSALTSTSWK